MEKAVEKFNLDFPKTFHAFTLSCRYFPGSRETQKRQARKILQDTIEFISCHRKVKKLCPMQLIRSGIVGANLRQSYLSILCP